MTIIPYRSVGDIHFGMQPNEVIKAIGEPIKIRKDWEGNLQFYYQGYTVSFDKDQKVESVTFYPDFGMLRLNDVNIFASATAFQDLIRLDGMPLKSYDIIILLNIGVSLSGFHEDYDDEKSITVFRQGAWDHRKDMKPYQQGEQYS